MSFVGDRLEDFSVTRPDDIALNAGAASWTWRHFVDKIEEMEAFIRERTSQGGRVGLLLEDPDALLICFFACARTARIAMVLDSGWPIAQLKNVLDAAAPDLLIDGAIFLNLPSIPAASLRRSDSREAPPREDDPFYCGFTSGSTGTPKGYLRTHGSWLKSFEVSDREFGIRGTERIVLAGQLTHSLHLYGAVCGLAAGHGVVLAPRFDPRTLLSALARADTGATLYATPTQLHFLAEAAERSGPVEAVHHVLASGAKWQDKDRQRLTAVFPNAGLFEFYGASETSFITISGPDGDAPPGSVGQAPPEVEIAIGTPDSPEPPGTAGAIWVKGALLFTGYHCGNDPLTRWQDGWLTFGDVGCLDENGYLFLVGRTGRMIVTSGLNVYPEEIEEVLLAHPGVSGAVVTGLSDPVRGQRLEAAVEVRAPLPDFEGELLRHCREHLAPGKWPRRFHLYERLPATPGGKPDIQRVALELQNKEAAE
ncbi:AMP-binding protein [uncultured Roseibium sp.]|uniref:AMP-binding protein n=1 Tax=uncultured Roseibium sp. TaxID=1936171 RepID=UPI002608D6F5|nr:AMP-binding protein [uncultured Roseibium sp.]